MSEEEKKDLEYIKESPTSREIMLLRIISKLQADIEIKDKVIDEVTKEIEILRQYFDESSQPDFIRILEILRK